MSLSKSSPGTKDPLFVNTNEVEVPTKGGTGEEVKMDTTVENQETEKPNFDSSKKRMRMEDGTEIVEVVKNEEELKKDLAFYKKSYENAKILLEEKEKELDEVHDSVETATTEMEHLVREN